MSKYSHDLPQLSGDLFLTDGGVETELIFSEGLELPHFAAFVLLESANGRAALDRYFRKYAAIARDHGVGFILESATWRGSSDWGARLGYAPEALAALNREAISLLAEIRDDLERPDSPMVISGCVGPRGDGYDPSHRMTASEAAEYHATQVRTFSGTEADLVTAVTMNYVEEAVGVVLAAAVSGMPSVVSFTVETDGRLPTGQPLGEAIDQIDEETLGGPAYYMINCAHPTHFEDTLEPGTAWATRVRGIRGNASKMSHAELDEATELDDGNPGELGADYRRITDVHAHINVLGGCCGTDHRHIGAIAEACVVSV